ncbi:PorP/SprF family type IX secretion system membrane protein [Neotamlana nanhaiensis]|uniref:PorP/SprF family type IX secretion system membrane protein n=1 Tax=Neotamlana nanhaiensis TaxID=1382798 RepID=UPI0005CC4FA5|nr:type IX secretion system membrane protein PorP/SprF [Tamlana nanhaiensis]
MRKIKLSILIILSGLFFKAEAQDPVFTQYFLVPETLNPGFSGFEDATYFGILHRTQWPSLDLRINTQYAFINTWIENLDSGVGFSILNQHENNTNFNHLQANVNYAYIVRLGNDWAFRPAVELGFGTRSFNFSGIVLGDQLNINSGTVSNSSSDPFAMNANDNKTFFDFTAGFVFDQQNIYNDTDLWFGFAIKHLNRPNISFVENSHVPLDIFYSVHANYKFPYLDRNKMQVSLNYMQQGEFNRLDIGTNIKLSKLFIGATAVTNPNKNHSQSHLLTSVNTFIGLEYEKLRFGFSYDFNTTKIGNTNGVYEISLTYLAGCLICRDPARMERRK